jgi:uncharacterized protein (TIGR03435 family)
MMFLLMSGSAAVAQAPPSPPRFEVASIKPTASTALRGGRLSSPPITTRPGVLNAHNASLLQLIRGAFALESYQISGGPAWIDSAGFDVDAKSADPANRDQLLLMLRTLLTDRFHLAFHQDKKPITVWALVVIKGTSKLRPAAPASDGGRAPRDHLRLQDLPSLATYLTRLSPDQPVLDQTNLTGSYLLDLDIAKISAEASQAAGNDQGPSLQHMFDATANYLQNELGLKLTPAKAPVDLLMIDHAEKPTAN